MSDNWQQFDLLGGGLQSANLRLARLLKRREAADPPPETEDLRRAPSCAEQERLLAEIARRKGEKGK